MQSKLIFVIILAFVAGLVLSACGSRQESSSSTEQLEDQSSPEFTQIDTSEDGEVVHEESDVLESDEHDEEIAHEEGDDHGADEHNEEGEDHSAGAHGIPEDAALIPNPVAADTTSIAAGERVYATSCAVCHGETGMGDGAGGAALDPPPANLHEDHVQILSDGALFFTIHNGVEGTAMVAWEQTLSDEDIWNVVNFIRTYGE